jgi:hypothetical protein
MIGDLSDDTDDSNWNHSLETLAKDDDCNVLFEIHGKKHGKKTNKRTKNGNNATLLWNSDDGAIEASLISSKNDSNPYLRRNPYLHQQVQENLHIMVILTMHCFTYPYMF